MAATANASSLVSWIQGAAKSQILDFVARVTRQGGQDFVPPAERIAVFDNDGTLWSEQPMPTLGAFAAIFDDSGRILCVRMNYASRAWTTPGGRVEAGESPIAALKREVLEESGLDVIEDGLVGVYSKPLKDDLVLFFRARVLGRNQWQPNDEISEIGYFGRDDLPEPMGLGVRTRIIDALDGITGIVRVIPES